MNPFDPTDVIAVAIERAAHGCDPADPESTPSPEAVQDVADILALLGGPDDLEDFDDDEDLDDLDDVPDALEQKGIGPPPRPGLVFDHQKHRWVRPQEVGTQNSSETDLLSAESGAMIGSESAGEQQAATEGASMGRLQRQILEGARASSTRAYSFTVATGEGPQGGQIRSGRGFYQAAEALVAAGLMRRIAVETDTETKRGNSITSRVYTYKLVD